MAKKIFAANSLTGGVSGSLDDITYTNIDNGNIAIVIDVATEKAYFYRYDTTEVGAESSPSIIVPDDNLTGTGAWVQVGTSLNDLTISGDLSIGNDLDVVGDASAGSLQLGGAGATPTEFSTDDTLSGDSDTAIPTEQAVKGYVDTQISGLEEGNFIINGCMRIAQRGTSFASMATGTYTLDRWRYDKTGAMVHTITQETAAPSTSNLYYSLKCDCTTADTSIAAGDFTALLYIMEGYDYQLLAGTTARLSFWVRATKTGTYCVSFFNAGLDRSYVKEYTVDVTNTWEHKSVTVPLTETGGTWNYTNGQGLLIYFTLAAGTTYQGSADTWNSALYLGTSNQVNACDSTSNDFELTGVQMNSLENAPAGLEFPYRSIGKEFLLCMRYYQESSIATNVVNYTGSIARAAYLPFVPGMRTSPTLTATNISGGMTVNFVNLTRHGVGTHFNRTATVGTGTYVNYDHTADAEL